ncbi:hypothetical protein RQP46_011187 [Phenoliferia psychrophenolica]
MASQLAFHQASPDPWCQAGIANEPVWDGVDFSPCFRRRVINGLIPAAWLALSLLSILSILLYTLFTHLRKRSSRSTLPSNARRSSNSASRRVSESSSAESPTQGPQAIVEAENEVILSIVQEESIADLSSQDILELGVGGVGKSARRCAAEGEGEGDAGGRTEKEVSFAMVGKAILGTKKNLLGVIGSVAVTALLVGRLVEGREDDGANWYWAMALAWAWTALLTLAQLALAFTARLRRLQHPGSTHRVPAWYSHLELHYIPWLLVSSILTFFDLRSAILSPIDSSLPLATATFAATKGMTPPPAPEMNASLFALATFSFVDSFMISNAFPSPSSPPITMDSVPDLRPDDKTARVLLSYRRDVASLNANRGPGMKRKAFGLTARLMWHFRRQLLVQQFWSYVSVSVVGLPPLFLRGILAHINKRQRGEEAPLHVALLFAGALFFFQTLGALASSQSLYIGRRICIRLRSIVVGEVFTKALRRKDMAGSSVVSPTADGTQDSDEKGSPDKENLKASSGKILNLVSVDTYRVSEVCASAASRLFFVYQKRLLRAGDDRLNLATEVIASVRTVKYFAWEGKFLEKMQITRDKELAQLWARALAMVAGNVLTSGAPILVSVATFVFHTKILHRDLTAETAFTALALFNILSGPLKSFTDMLANILQAYVSLQRIDAFLTEEETAKYSVIRAPTSGSDPRIGFSNGTFTWSDEQVAVEDPSVFRIRNLNLNFPVGKLSLILGPVGSGKSTLLMSLLGETNKLEGASFLPSPVVRSTGLDPAVLTDTTAYCSQSPWLLSATIKDNILFGSLLNEDRYQNVVDVCALAPDLLQFEFGDETEHLFAKCLTGSLMRHRSVVLVTHAADLCLPGASFVVSMDNGSIISSGPPDLLAASSIDHKDDGAVAPAVTIEAIASEEASEDITVEQAEAKRARQEKIKLVKDETMSEGSVSNEVYLLYLRAMGGWWLAAVLLAIFIGAQAAEIGVSLALRYWAASYDDEENSTGQLAAMTLHTSINRWRALPSLFFPATEPLSPDVKSTEYWLRAYVLLGALNIILYGGRVSTNSESDMETIDQDVARAGMFLLLQILGVMGIIGSISAVLPAFLFAALIITLVYWGIGFVYLASSRELKRHDSVSKSPIFGLFGETLNGVATIRAFGDGARFTRQLLAMINTNNRPFFALWQANRWLSVRVDVAGAFVSLAAAIFILSTGNMDAALAGFVMTFAISFNDHMLWVVRYYAVVEMNLNSVERVREYLELEQESKAGIVPPARWPSRDGSIEVQNLTASYAEDLPPVLKNVSFKILPKEKVGICGRTGSGKSTLGLSFFRFIEPSSGRIVIDGIDINTLSLPELRSRLTIVAQESALFAGTLRFNLDPFDAYADADIWDALRRTQMAAPNGSTPRESRAPSRAPSIKASSEYEESGIETTVTEADERYIVKSLEMAVLEGGKNFSAGQRQLLSLARGILKLSTSSILLLDESTASLDQATDERIQDTIRTQMSSATILCIAHRLRTIIDYDKILVLDQGEVVEFDTPWSLLARESSAFAALCQKSGEYPELLRLANAKRDGLGA